MLKAGGRKEARNRKTKQMINNNKVNNKIKKMNRRINSKDNKQRQKKCKASKHRL